jgi:hypothetical protein
VENRRGIAELAETLIGELRQIYDWMAVIAQSIEAVRANVAVVAARAEVIAARAGQEGATNS